MSMLLRRGQAHGRGSATGIAADGQSKALRSPTGTLGPMARGLSSQHLWEQAPRLLAAKPCFPRLRPAATLDEASNLPRHLASIKPAPFKRRRPH